MECSAVRKVLTAAVDGELDLRESADVDGHLQSCAACRAQLEAGRSLRSAVGRGASYFRAPPELEARIRAALPATSAARASVPRPRFWQWPIAVGALATVFAIAATIGLYTTLPGVDERIADEIVSSHVRSLLANHAVDVASSDQHTVKPWFAGKIDFSPPVRDFAAEGFPLVGGRLDYIDHHTVAALVYKRAQHTINVFAVPMPEGTADAAPRAGSTHGLHTVRWTRDGMTFWAVSDVGAEDLARLVALLRAAEAPK
ncbi:MAG TPA: anti-sigma factor [Casimicrobiaceae bacterium]|nr:anti-sigma factor [Casimicrobiaceae bacterium]